MLFQLHSWFTSGRSIVYLLFILSSEMLFVQVRENQNIEGLKIFGHEFKLSAFADDTTCFVKHEAAGQELKSYSMTLWNFPH